MSNINKINGVSFEEYAAASANLAQGMTAQEAAHILALSEADFHATLEAWNDQFGILATTDMEIVTKFGEIFSQPKVGRFAQNGKTVSMTEISTKVPTLEAYLELFFRAEAAEKSGILAQDIYAMYDINLAEFVELGNYYFHGEGALDPNDPQHLEKHEARLALEHHIREKWLAFYGI